MSDGDERAPEDAPPFVLADPDPLGPLVRDMTTHALRSELGALAFYTLLPKVVRHKDLRKLLALMRQQEREQVSRLRAVIRELGGDPPSARFTRSLAAWALFAATPVCGSGFALRICREAERTVSRWYAEYAVALHVQGRNSQAETCRDLSLVKHVHATRLEAFVNHLRR